VALLYWRDQTVPPRNNVGLDRYKMKLIAIMMTTNAD
jgi:hypothetical protein